MGQERGQWNRAARRSGGDRKVRIVIDRQDAELLRQEAMVRAEFGEAGVKRFWEELEKRANQEGE